jgi:hypothetical protein
MITRLDRAAKTRWMVIRPRRSPGPRPRSSPGVLSRALHTAILIRCPPRQAGTHSPSLDLPGSGTPDLDLSFGPYASTQPLPPGPRIASPEPYLCRYRAAHYVHVEMRRRAQTRRFHFSRVSPRGRPPTTAPPGTIQQTERATPKSAPSIDAAGGSHPIRCPNCSSTEPAR